MSEFKNILVATDFSDTSIKAFENAASLASQLNAVLHIVHIVQIHPSNMPESGNVKIEELEAKEEKSANDSLKKYVDGLDKNLAVTTSVVHGDPVSRIIKLVEEKQADLIVMGTHGRTGISKLLMGSVAESVMKKSKVPVMCVRGA